MDSLITAAAHALLASRSPALALRSIAMAQLGDFARAKELLRSAARAFGSKEAVARGRCIVAEAEIALASRDLSFPGRVLATILAPGGGGDSGLAWAEGTLWVGSIGIGRSIKSIPIQARFFAPSSPTASSPGSAGSMESSGTPPGKVMTVI